MTIADLQQEFLASGNQLIAPEDFFILLAHSLGKEKTFVMAHPEYVLDTKSQTRARNFFARRLTGEPVALIVGHKEFYGRDFIVTQDTLIPRPETELLVELVLQKIMDQEQITKKTKRHTSIIDVGTGSGNIIISIATELKGYAPRFSFHATDISERALLIAKKNADRHGIGNSIEFRTGNLLEPFREKAPATDEVIIIANLPYLSLALYKNAPKDVRLFEPKSALLSGKAGLDHYTRLLQSASNFFPQANALSLFLEISPEQSTPLQTIASDFFPGALLRIHRDLANKARVLKICREKNSS